jgi:formate hydrogenlyase subunit 3/multisubunit Na+/H+ antiporter MnhD subunit
VTRRLVLAVTLSILSVGWLVPLCFAASFYLTGFENLARGTEAGNSFPYFRVGWEALRLGAIWCTLSAVVWTTYGINRILSPQRFGKTMKE